MRQSRSFNSYSNYSKYDEEGVSVRRYPRQFNHHTPRSWFTLTRIFLFLIPAILLSIGYFEYRRSASEFNVIAGLKEVKPVADNGLIEEEVEAVVDVSSVDRTVFNATESPQVESVEISDGPGVNTQTVESAPSPLALLRTGYHNSAHNLLMATQLGLDAIDPLTGWTLLHYLARSTSTLALRLMLSRRTYGPEGVNLQSRNVRLEEISPRSPFPQRTGHILGGDTPLHLAVTHPNRILALVLSHLLLEFDADPDIPNSAGQSPRQLAASCLHFPEITQVLNGTLDPKSICETDTQCYMNFAFARGPPAEPYFFY